MFDVGFSELVVIGLVALLVLGPKRLPEVARTAGRWMGQFRRFADGVRQDFQSEINAAEFNELRKIKDDLNQAREVFEGSLAPPERATGDTADPPVTEPSFTDAGSKPVSKEVAQSESKPLSQPLSAPNAAPASTDTARASGGSARVSPVVSPTHAPNSTPDDLPAVAVNDGRQRP